MTYTFPPAVDTAWNGAEFRDMRLAGITLVVCGFFLVLFPSDWSGYLAALIR